MYDLVMYSSIWSMSLIWALFGLCMSAHRVVSVLVVLLVRAVGVPGNASWSIFRKFSYRARGHESISRVLLVAFRMLCRGALHTCLTEPVFLPSKWYIINSYVPS